MTIAEVNGAQLHYERSGAGEPLVLVHGSWVDCRVWDDVAPLLGGSFEIVVYDRRGHSLSTCPPGQGSVHDDVDDLAALIDVLGAGPAHVAGASFGGSIALRLAAYRPDALLSIAVHEPPLFDLLDHQAVEPSELTELTELRADLCSVAARLEAGDLEGGARLYFDRVAHSPGGWPGLDPARRRALIEAAPTYLDQYRDPDALRIDLGNLAAFDGPALVTHGDRRSPFFRRMAEMVSAALPGARSELIPGTAHDPQVTHPGAYTRAIEKFASRRATDLSAMPAERKP
jgi:pimeloyl-ACP methyl ester carboxylesterase